MPEFTKKFKTQVIQLEKKTEKALNKSILQLYRNIIDRTPVGDPSLWTPPRAPAGYIPGNLKKSWSISFGRNQQRDPNTGRYMSQSNLEISGGIKLNFLGKGGKSVVSIVNPAPYAWRVEYQGWSWKQRPEGMMRVSLLEFPGLIGQNIKGI